MKNEKIKCTLKLEIYNKGGATWYCDYYFYNGINFEKETTRASRYGYDKHSTATSEAINKFNFLYKFKNGLKWDGMMQVSTKENKTIYGIYKGKHISYGIGISSVLNCLNAFSNVKIASTCFGNHSDFIQLEIVTTEKALQKEIEKNNKIINNKKVDKYDKKEAKEKIARIKDLFKMEV